MPRAARFAPGGIVYHVLNRAVGRSGIFDDEGDYLAFEKVLTEAVQKHRTRLLAHCLMPNHFHLVLWPALDGDLSIFMRWLCTTHVRRWHQHRHTWGRGHVYQGRFKSFPVQTDEHFLAVCRYVERNALRARLVERAEDWPWCSLGQRQRQQADPKLSDWPVERPTDWLWWVNEPQTEKELAEVRECVARGRPYGQKQWQMEAARRLGLESTFRRRGPVPRRRGPPSLEPAS